MAYKVIQDPFKRDDRLKNLIERLKDQEYADGLIERMKVEGAFLWLWWIFWIIGGGSDSV